MISYQIQNVFIFLNRVFRFVIWKIKTKLLWNYYYNSLREPKIISTITLNPRIQNEIVNLLKKNDFKVINFKIDLTDYKHYLSNAEYYRFPRYYGSGRARNFIEKTLEHYLSAKLLNLSEDDVYIDIANANSPVPEIYYKLYGCKVYRQDLMFPKGIHGNIIGGNAANMPLNDNFATKLALHCSFEHFEQDSDIKFIKEASRVLKKGGKLCILPLYLFNKYAILTDPAILPKNCIAFENDAILYCVKGYRNRHGRFYDIPHLITRIKNNLNNLKLTIYVVQNEKDVALSCYIKFIALFE